MTRYRNPKGTTYAQIPGEIYIVHLSRNLHHAHHYIGFAESNSDGSSSLEERIKLHRKNQGSKLLAAINQLGIDWDVAMSLPSNKLVESFLHKKKQTTWFCPVCCGRTAVQIIKTLRRVYKKANCEWKPEYDEIVERSVKHTQ